MAITVRAAEARDVPALVRLRTANARAHVELAPELYRVPDPEVVREHFAAALAGGASCLVRGRCRTPVVASAAWNRSSWKTSAARCRRGR
jgi:hypothetical protein